MKYDYLYMDPWSAIQKENTKNINPIYIALSGNSGAGKSTLLRKISTSLFEYDQHTIAIDEKAVHHNLLQYLFENTKEYGYLLQLNFMIERALLLKSWLDKGYNLVMERSHIEDYIFINFMYKSNYITKKQYEVYINLWNEINSILRKPDIIVFLDFGIEHSLNNILNDELKGIRPREFTTDKQKEEWIEGWALEYNSFIEYLPNELKDKVLICKDQNDINNIFDKIKVKLSNRFLE